MTSSSKKFQILIGAGGTGGHVFPAQALAKQLLEKEHDVLFMGKGLSSNLYFSKDFPHFSIDSATPFQKGTFRKALSFVSLIKGVIQALKKMNEYKPDLVVGFGSFHSFPVLAAAFLKRVPIVLYESNSVPGKVNRLFSRYAHFSGVQFSNAQESLKGTCYEVKMPFWKEKALSKQEALEYFSLKPNLLTFLVFGGSQGAAFINPIVARALKKLHEDTPFQVIHMTGTLRSSEEMKTFYKENEIEAVVKPFETHMNFAWALADMAICRSGAATLAELVEYEVPSILIPFPSASDNHQVKNALFLEEARGSFCLEEKNLNSHSLFSLLKKCDIPSMKKAIVELKKQKTKQSLLERIETFLETK